MAKTMSGMTAQIEASDAGARRFLNTLLSDAFEWFDQESRNCSACVAEWHNPSPDAWEACPEHLPDYERSRELINLEFCLRPDDDVTGLTIEPLSADQIRVLREALPMAMARRDGKAVEDLALMAAYRELARQLGVPLSKGRTG